MDLQKKYLSYCAVIKKFAVLICVNKGVLRMCVRKQTGKALVSVIIPTFKGSNTIRRAILSLFRQSYKSIEVIVVDDNGEGSEEQRKTQKQVERFSNVMSIKYIAHKQNRNGAAARNTGMNQASGEYFAFLDDDDIYLHDRIQTAVSSLEIHSDCDLFFCGVIIQRNGNLVNWVTPIAGDNIRKELLLNTGLFGTGSNIFIRNKVFTKTSGFNENYFRRQDNEFLLRALQDSNYIISDNIGIVKCNSGVSNIPSYKKMIISNELYNRDFSCLIEDLSDSEKKYYYEKEHSWLFFCCMMKEDNEAIENEKKNLREFRNLTKKEEIQYHLAKIRIRGKSLLKYIHPIISVIINHRKHNKIIKKINSEMLDEIIGYNII